MKKILLIALAILAGGCAHTVPPGPEHEQTMERAYAANSPPSRVGIVETGINWQAAGASNTKAVRVTPDEITQLGSGPATRQIVYQTPDGGRFVLASETDFGVDSLDYTPGEGRLLVRGFRTSAAEPTRALADPLAQWVAEVREWAPAERETVVERLRQEAATMQALAPTAAKALIDLAAIIAGV